MQCVATIWQHFLGGHLCSLVGQGDLPTLICLLYSLPWVGQSGRVANIWGASSSSLARHSLHFLQQSPCIATPEQCEPLRTPHQSSHHTALTRPHAQMRQACKSISTCSPHSFLHYVTLLCGSHSTISLRVTHHTTPWGPTLTTSAESVSCSSVVLVHQHTGEITVSTVSPLPVPIPSTFSEVYHKLKMPKASRLKAAPPLITHWR